MTTTQSQDGRFILFFFRSNYAYRIIIGVDGLCLSTTHVWMHRFHWLNMIKVVLKMCKIQNNSRYKMNNKKDTTKQIRGCRNLKTWCIGITMLFFVNLNMLPYSNWSWWTIYDYNECLDTSVLLIIATVWLYYSIHVRLCYIRSWIKKAKIVIHTSYTHPINF